MERVSPNKTQFNQDRLFFFDDVVHAIAFSLCCKLLAVGSQTVVPTVFLVQDFQKVVVGGAATSAANTVTLTLHPDAEEVVGRMLPSKMSVEVVTGAA